MMNIIKRLKNVVFKYKPYNCARRRKKIRSFISFKDDLTHKLRDYGFTKLKPYSLGTWKVYKDSFRVTYLGIYKKTRYIIKITIGFEEKVKNSIMFQTKFNNVFDFIPNGFGFLLANTYTCLALQYIEGLTFNNFFAINNVKPISFFTSQALHILESLNKYRIVHCDLVGINVIISKKECKMFLIDFDTCCSENHEFYCDAFPAYTISRMINGKRVFDDAYSFYCLFSSIQNISLADDISFAKIKKMININTHVN